MFLAVALMGGACGGSDGEEAQGASADDGAQTTESPASDEETSADNADSDSDDDEVTEASDSDTDQLSEDPATDGEVGEGTSDAGPGSGDAPDIESIDDLREIFSQSVEADSFAATIAVTADGEIPAEFAGEFEVMTAEILVDGDNLSIEVGSEGLAAMMGDEMAEMESLFGDVDLDAGLGMRVVDGVTYASGFFAAMFGVDEGWIIFPEEDESPADELTDDVLFEGSDALLDHVTDWEVVGIEDLDGSDVTRVRLTVDLESMSRDADATGDFGDQLDPLDAGEGTAAMDVLVTDGGLRGFDTETIADADGSEIVYSSMMRMTRVGDDSIEVVAPEDAVELTEEAMMEALFGGAMAGAFEEALEDGGDELFSSGGFDSLDSDADGYGDDPELDLLWDACDKGDGDACDDLFMSSPFGSEYEAFGSTCGDTGGNFPCASEFN